jgi:hypothetical protein
MVPSLLVPPIAFAQAVDAMVVVEPADVVEVVVLDDDVLELVLLEVLVLEVLVLELVELEVLEEVDVVPASEVDVEVEEVVGFNTDERHSFGSGALVPPTATVTLSFEQSGMRVVEVVVVAQAGPASRPRASPRDVTVQRPGVCGMGAPFMCGRPL